MHDRRSLLALLFALPLVGWGALSLYYSPLPAPWATVAAAGFAQVALLFFLFAFFKICQLF